MRFTLILILFLVSFVAYIFTRDGFITMTMHVLLGALITNIPSKIKISNKYPWVQEDY